MKQQCRQNARPGSVILTSLIVLIAISLVTASVVKLSTFDYRMNVRVESNMSGRLVTESVLENGAAQVDARLMATSTLTKNMLVDDPLETIDIDVFPESMDVSAPP